MCEDNKRDKQNENKNARLPSAGHIFVVYGCLFPPWKLVPATRILSGCLQPKRKYCVFKIEYVVLCSGVTAVVWTPGISPNLHSKLQYTLKKQNYESAMRTLEHIVCQV